MVQRNSLKTWEGAGDFRDLAAADPDIAAALTPAELKACFAIDPYLEKIDYIFERVLSHEG
jgi:adenylosuccinate lyase